MQEGGCPVPAVTAQCSGTKRRNASIHAGDVLKYSIRHTVLTDFTSRAVLCSVRSTAAGSEIPKRPRGSLKAHPACVRSIRSALQIPCSVCGIRPALQGSCRSKKRISFLAPRSPQGDRGVFFCINSFRKNTKPGTSADVPGFVSLTNKNYLFVQIQFLTFIPIPAARRCRVRRDGFAFPRSSLLISACAMPVRSESCFWVRPLSFRASIMACAMVSSG